MSLEKASGLKETRKERNNIPWAEYELEKWERVAAGPRQCKLRELGFYGKLMNPKDKDKVIGPGKPNEVSKKLMGVWN